MLLALWYGLCPSPVVQNARLCHPDPFNHPQARGPDSAREPDPRPTPLDTPDAGGRLNLLLSYAGWEPESWVDQLPPLLEPMGVRSLRAGTGTEATRVIRSHKIHIAVVDLGLPLDGSADADGPEPGGPRLLELLTRLETRPPTVVVRQSRTHRDDARDLRAALSLGAFAVVDRPRSTRDLELMLEVLRRALVRHYRGRWPGLES